MILDPMAREQALGNLGWNISNYKYWGDRLRYIDEIFKDSSPNTVNQWWKDRRNGPQRWPLALAALALFLTVVLGIFQVTAAYIQLSGACSSSKSV
jgi:hypothetical protein